MRIARQNGSRGRRSSGRLVAMMVAAAAAPVICVCQAQAASITKADTNTLGTGTDWVGGVSPGVNDIALFDATISTGNEAALTSSANLSWSGINVGTVNGPIVINNSPAFNLSLGIAGINMIAASANLTLNSNLILSPGGQTWTIASGRTLAVNPGTFTRTVGSSVVFNNSGTISTTTLTNSNGILGPWAIVSSSGTAANNTAAGYTYANVSGGSIVAYTGATAGTGFNWTLTNPSTSNYDISAGNGTSAIGTSRTANTVRYTGAATTEYYGSNDTAILTLNGLLNAGGALVLAQNNPSSNPTTSFGKLEIGSTNELVLAAANAGITVAFPIINNGSAASSVTVMGPSVVTLSGLNTFSGGVNLDSGTLVVNSAETAGTSGPLGITGAIFFGGGTLAYGAANSYDYSSRFSNAPNQVYRINTNSANVSYATGFNSSGSSLIKSGAGILTLNASNGNLTGGTTIAGGTVLANNNNALGSAGISTSNVSGAQLSLGSGINLANPLTINGGGVAAQGIVWVPTGNATYTPTPPPACSAARR